MEDKKQTIATIIKIIALFFSSIFYGFISCWWLAFAIVAMFPESGPGERDWIEDSSFIPLGYVTAMLWLIVTGICMFSLRKKKSNMMIYIITTVFSIGVTLLILSNR